MALPMPHLTSRCRTGIILCGVRAAVRVSLVVIGAAIIVLAIVKLVGTVVDGGATRIAWSAVRSVLLGGAGSVVARAGVRYHDPAGSS